MDSHRWITLLDVAVNVAFWGLIAWGLYAIHQSRGRQVVQKTPEENLLDRLRDGEIDQREYEERLALLRATPPPAPSNTGPARS